MHNGKDSTTESQDSIGKMEDNQQSTDTQSGIADMNLQETLRIPREEEDQNEVFHDSLTEAQWREQLDAPASGQERSLQDREQMAGGAQQADRGAEGDGRHHPPIL